MKALSGCLVVVAGLVLEACVYVPPVWEQATEEEIGSIEVGVTDRATIIKYFGKPNVLDHERFIVHRGREDWGFLIVAGAGAGWGLIREKNTHLAIEFNNAGIVEHVQVEQEYTGHSLSRYVTLFRLSLRAPEEHYDFGLSLAFSSTVSYLAVGDSRNRVFLWDNRVFLWDGAHSGVPLQHLHLRSGEEPRVFAGEKSCGFWTRPRRCDVSEIAFSPDETKLAASMVDNTVVVWDIGTSQPLYSLDLEWNDFWGGDRVSALSFSYDGRVLATGDENGGLALWDGATGRLLQEIEAHDSDILALDYSSDGKWLITASRDGTAKVWLTSSLSEIDQIEREAPLTAVSFSEDGSQLAIASEFHIELWDVGNKAETNEPTPFGRLSDVFVMPVRDRHSYVGQSISFSPDNQRLIGVAGSAVIWSVETRQIEAELLPGPNCCGQIASISAAAFHPEGDLIVTAGNDGVTVWDVPN